MIPGHDLRCQTPADVYLLLKSSDFIIHDLDHAFDECVDVDLEGEQSTGEESGAGHEVAERTERLALSDDTRSVPPRARPQLELVLKKWFDMPKSQEWRCFVRGRQLLGAYSPLRMTLRC